MTAIATFAAGQPILLTAPTGAAGIYLRSGALSGNLRNNGFMWFDTACFPLALQGYFGNSGRTVLNGPGLNNWDIGLEKAFPLEAKESVRLLFRAEAFNAWNHTQFQPPNGNAGDGANFGRVSSRSA